jgi:hypothetical protein
MLETSSRADGSNLSGAPFTIDQVIQVIHMRMHTADIYKSQRRFWLVLVLALGFSLGKLHYNCSSLTIPSVKKERLHADILNFKQIVLHSASFNSNHCCIKVKVLGTDFNMQLRETNFHIPWGRIYIAVHTQRLKEDCAKGQWWRWEREGTIWLRRWAAAVDRYLNESCPR